MGSTLFIVGSPFQCLCMLEAINHFQIQDYAVLVVYGDRHSLENIRILLKESNVQFEEKKLAHIINDFFPLVFSKHRHFENVFIGDYYNVLNEIIGRLYAKRKYNLFYLDDGTQALSIFSDKPINRYKTSKEKFVLRFYYYCLKWKRCLSTNFFTIYNVVTDKMNIIHNNLSLLKQKTGHTPQGIYIIGTNSSVLDFRDRPYIDYLDKLLTFVTTKWPNEYICYCPHRRDANNEKYKEWCKNNGVNYYEPSVSVEFDFTKKGINPVSIIGFTSNALYTLKAICPSSEVDTIDYRLSDACQDEETEVIRQQMVVSGIKLLRLFEE